ncbi:MAG: efflux RND transporter periplasmic adaptor subunit [Bacteroidota bacterium]|jgi:membrane fusion protein (multidrug efflux system)
MKNIAYISLISVGAMLGACGDGAGNKSDKQAQLEKLKKELNGLENKTIKLKEEILILENELGKGDGANNSKMVEIETVKPSNFSSYIVLEGVADADQSTVAMAKVPGTVTAVLVQPGASVRAGQILAKIDNSAINQGRAELENRLVFANTVFDKQKRLWESGIGTEIQYLTAKNQKEALEKSLATLDAQIDMYNIKSPIAGTIESVDLRIGQTAAPGIPAFRVVNMSNIKVTTEVAETYSKKIKTGDNVLIQFPSIQKTVESRVSFASKFIDPMNRTFKIEVRLGAIENLKPNMVAKIKITDYHSKNAISVPTNAIQRTENGEFVMVAELNDKKDFVAKKLQIVSGKSSDGRTEILSGLKESDNIIVVGFQELNEGQIVSGAWVKG